MVEMKNALGLRASLAAPAAIGEYPLTKGFPLRRAEVDQVLVGETLSLSLTGHAQIVSRKKSNDAPAVFRSGDSTLSDPEGDSR